MKIRNGFVSNSSSSSFIISVTKNYGKDVCPHCGRKDKSIEELIENSGEYDEDTRIDEKNENVIDYIKENYFDGISSELCSKIEKELKNGNSVYNLSVSYHNHIGQELRDLEKIGKIKILDSDS